MTKLLIYLSKNHLRILASLDLLIFKTSLSGTQNSNDIFKTIRERLIKNQNENDAEQQVDKLLELASS